jgi:F420-dependent oxidoreductase-like protein
MKFELQHPNFTYDGPDIVSRLKRTVLRAESLGFDSFWVMDHFHQIAMVGSPDEPMLEGWMTQAAMASCTSKIKLGTLVTGVIYRHPSVLAKMAATLDVLSNGRLFMGIGAAWNEEESKAYGIYFPPVIERFRRLEEALQIIRKMWAEDNASFTGKYYNINGAYCNPKPVQQPHPPILIGGSGERQTLRLVAKYADACNLFGSTDTIRTKLSVLRDRCKEVGRDYDTILKTKLGHVIIDRDKQNLENALRNFPIDRRTEYVMSGSPEEVRKQIEAFRDVGIEHLIVNLDPKREQKQIELFASEIVSKLS